MSWWQIILASLVVWVAFFGLIIWGLADAYRRDAEEHGDNDAENR